MNPDNPKLTAYALDELDEIERQAIARAVSTSPEAQRKIQETLTMARLLRTEFAAELEHPADAAAKPLSANLSDIRDDPWFWTRARPLAIAAGLAVFAVIGLAFFRQLPTSSARNCAGRSTS
jgi:anti-sigma factor RsiW